MEKDEEVIPRTLEPHLRTAATRWPIITLTGPRQSGKTTLCRAVFPQLPWVSLEAPDVRARALADPRGFLNEYREGAILDEFQRVPELLSYLQGEIDSDPRPLRFVLTGSQNLNLMQAVTQSLAGRTALFTLLPFSCEELAGAGLQPPTLDEALFSGGYPRIHAEKMPPREWLSAYVGTYLERDVRQVLRIGDLQRFQSFLGLAAGRTAGLLNLTSLGPDAGIDHKTAKAWLTAMEAGYLLTQLRPYATNLGKRWIRAPKLHFLDAGLLCYLLGISEPSQLRNHPLRGAIFESWVAAELTKYQVHRGMMPDLYHWREATGTEVDLVHEVAAATTAIEVKGGMTVVPEYTRSLDTFLRSRQAAAPRPAQVNGVLVYGGDQALSLSGTRVLPWFRIHEALP